MSWKCLQTGGLLSFIQLWACVKSIFVILENDGRLGEKHRLKLNMEMLLLFLWVVWCSTFMFLFQFSNIWFGLLEALNVKELKHLWSGRSERLFVQTSLSPTTLSRSSWGISRRSQARWDMWSLQLVLGLPGFSSQVGVHGKPPASRHPDEMLNHLRWAPLIWAPPGCRSSSANL